MNQKEERGDMKMKVVILGAAGAISRMVTERLLEETDAELVLYARRAHARLSIENERVTKIDGHFGEKDKLIQAFTDADAVYLNDMQDAKATATILAAMQEAGVTRLIGATVLGLYGEVEGPFGQWNRRMVGGSLPRYQEAAQVVESSDLAYTLLRLTWLYDEADNENFTLTRKGEPFVGAQVTRQAVARLVVTLLQDSGRYTKESLGVSEPNTDWSKPSFY